MRSNSFVTIDYVIFFAYIVVIIFTGLWVSRSKKKERTSRDYFLADKSLTWWAIGASLIAANISAEQMIGMSGSGFAIGLGIASYEWMAAVTLILVGKFFLPIFIEKKIYTMPQFLEKRYDGRVRTAMAVFWLLVYVFVNLTSVLYLGALAMNTIMGVPMLWGIIGLALFAAVYSIYGGLKSVAWTDVIQVVVLMGGGLITVWLALDAVADGAGPLKGFGLLLEKAPGKFDMILAKDHPHYGDLPGLGVIIGGMWIANISYWGFNQYIIQRGLAAKSVREAQRGVLFAGYLKLIIPLIVVIPGIAAFVLTQGDPSIINPPDEAYPWLLHNFVPAGIKGLAFAALTAAIVSSLASMLNSASTIFTMDIYTNYIVRDADEKRLVRVGRLTSITALLLAVLTARPLLGGLDQAFQYIQEFTGFVTPGVCAIFLMGFFWKKTSANAALWSAILTIPLSFVFKWGWPSLPFIDRMGIVFVLIVLIAVVISFIDNRSQADPKAESIHKGLFYTDHRFNIGALGILIITAVLYILFW
ncbi:MAG: sodium/glucose cotransporter [Bacteroidetes bacterium]|nr:MAG: sodium/glucose cotransporter [Bacteroidota bacterium]